MKKIVIIIALFTWFSAHSQENKFDFGIGIFPNYSIGIISNNGNTPGFVESSYKGIETWKPSLSATVFVEYKLSEKSILGIGMGYQNNGERTKKLDLIFNVNPLNGNPVTDPSLPNKARFVYNHHNIEIPLYYRHVFGSRFFGLIGVSGIINISNTNTSILYFSDNSKERNTENDNSTDFRSFNFSGNIGFGVDYLKTEKMSFFVLPYFQYGFLGVSKTASLNRNFLSIGLSTGMRI